MRQEDVETSSVHLFFLIPCVFLQKSRGIVLMNMFSVVLRACKNGGMRYIIVMFV